MATSLPGQRTCTPSPLQNVPKLTSITPTLIFSAFSGTVDSWCATIAPSAPTTSSAASAASVAISSACPVLPRVRTMITTSKPSRNVPLNATSTAARASASLSCCVVVAKMASSSCLGSAPAARSTALRNHCSPKINRMPPITVRSTGSGMCVSSGPTAATRAAKSTNAPSAPAIPRRQPAVAPTATTIVRASTTSTAQAKKTPTISTTSSVWTMPWLRASPRRCGPGALAGHLEAGDRGGGGDVQGGQRPAMGDGGHEVAPLADQRGEALLFAPDDDRHRALAEGGVEEAPRRLASQTERPDAELRQGRQGGRDPTHHRERQVLDRARRHLDRGRRQVRGPVPRQHDPRRAGALGAAQQCSEVPRIAHAGDNHQEG